MSDVKLHKALELMNQRGLDGLIIYSSGRCNILRPSYLYYFSGFRPMGSRNAAIVSRGGEVVLLVEPSWDAARASRKSWIADVRGSDDFLREFGAVVRALKITGSVGIVGSQEMPREIYGGIAKDCAVVLADSVIEEMSREKTKQELELVRHAARVADIGFGAFLHHTRVGIREYELVAEMEYAMRLAGADDMFILLSSDKHNYEMHEPTDRRLREGDIVIGEITPVCEGQFIQLCGTIVLGEPSAVVVEQYDLLLRALQGALGQVRANVPASLIPRAMNEVFSEAGYAKYCHPPYMRARGHGFGVGSIAPGAVLADDTKGYLERHQVIAVHPNQYLPETGYLACGETVLVTDTGMERLAQIEMKLYVKEGR